MALFCDKYDAGLALSPWSELWLQRLRFEPLHHHGNLLALAYALDNQESFWVNSRSMILYDSCEDSDGTRDVLVTLLPHGLHASIDQDRKSGLLDLSSMVESIMARFLQDGTRGLMRDTHLIKAGFFFQELYRLNIWPVSTRTESINLDYIQRSITDFNDQDNTSFKGKLINVIAKAVDAQKGLCLSCVRKGKISSHQGNCHARLRYLCTG